MEVHGEDQRKSNKVNLILNRVNSDVCSICNHIEKIKAICLSLQHMLVSVWLLCVSSRMYDGWM